MVKLIINQNDAKLTLPAQQQPPYKTYLQCQQMQQILNNQYQESQTLYFCYKIIYFLSMAIISIILCLVCFAMANYTIFKFLLIKKVGAPLQVKITYFLIVMWAIFYISKFVVADVSFIIYQDQDNSYAMSIFSRYVFSLDVSSVFVLQTALVMIPLNFMVRIIDVFKDFTSYQETTQENGEERFKFEKRCCLFFKTYIYIRLSYIVLVIYFCISAEQKVQTTIATIILVLLPAQTFLLLVMFILGLYSLQKNQAIEDVVSEEDKQTMKNQYIILIVTTVLRLANCVWFVWTNVNQLDKNAQCGYVAPLKTSSTQLFIILVGEGIFTHFLPIFIILRIYRIQRQQIELSKSLLFPGGRSQQ